MAERLDAAVSYDAAGKETVVRLGAAELRYRTGSGVYSVNGKRVTMKGAAYTDKGVLMVPVTSFTGGLGLTYKVEGKRILLHVSVKPVVSFRVPEEIIAGETTVQYATYAYSPLGLPIVEEVWEGRQERFDAPGSYTVSYSAKDSAGNWSDPYILKLEVVNRNEPPTAAFTTDKTQYRMGELIQYTDLSTDDEEELTREWGNRADAFFEPGVHTVSLKVTDKRGAVSEARQDIVITNETLYNEEEFGKRFAPAGKNFPIDGTEVKTMEALPYSYNTEPYTLFRSSGPETVVTDGVLYRDTIEGQARFLLHHKNRTGRKTKPYVIAANPGTAPVTITVQHEGMAGPSPSAEGAGRMSLARYFESVLANGQPRTVTLAPGESKVIFDGLSAKAMNMDDIVTFTGELTSDGPVSYTALMLAADKNPLAELPRLPLLDPGESIVRGTFADSNRVFRYEEQVGAKPVKLSLTDNAQDPFQQGYDAVKSADAVNSGNYGLLYKIQLPRVAPNTVIAFNPRGGLFVGSVLVNGNVVLFAHLGRSEATDTASVLYRTGEWEENVELWISPAAGSNLPFALLMLPVPEKRE